MRAGPVTVIALITAGWCGCASPAPTYQWMDHDAALRLMSERAARIRTLQSEARLVLTSSDGQSMTLDAAVAAAPPDWLRLRAWKLGHAVLDLTHTADVTWVKTADAQEQRGNAPLDPRALDAASLVDAWSILTGDLSGPRGGGAGPVEATDNGGPTFTVRRAVPARAGRSAEVSVICDIDRRTLTVRRCRVVEEGVERGVVSLGGYRDFDGVVFPTRIAATGRQGSVLVVLQDPEFNRPLAPGAFEPPAGATRQE